MQDGADRGAYRLDELGWLQFERLCSLARTTLMKLQSKPADEHWWVPQDIDAPPSTEPLTRRQISFSREDVDRVLADL